MTKIEKMKKPIAIYMVQISAILILIFLSLFILIQVTLHIQLKQNPDKIPSLFGIKTGNIETGSMIPTLKIGTIIAIKEIPENELQTNDIIAFNSNNMIIAHRIVKIEEIDGKKVYTTKGDANNTEDINTITYEQMEGKVIFHIDYIGNIVNKVKTSTGIISLLIIFLILIIFLQIFDKRLSKRITKRHEIRIKLENGAI